MGLKQKLEAGEFVVLAEMEPPKGVDVSTMITNAQRVKGRVDAFVVPEMSNAVMRMSSLGGAMLLETNGMETVFQMNCRDRNRIALQADLLSAYACGITNVMVVAGEEPSFGDHHQARSVYDIDLQELLKVIQDLQAGKDMAGIELQGAPQFLVGANIFAGSPSRSVEIEAEQMIQQKTAGAAFFISPPLFDLDQMGPFKNRVDVSKTHIIPTVLLLKSLGMARYMAGNMPHIHIPDDLISRIQGAGQKVRECIRIAAELVEQIRAAGFSGVMLSTLGWEHKLPEIL